MLNVRETIFQSCWDGSAASWVLPVLLGGKYVFLKDTPRRPEWGSSPRPLDPESEVFTTRPPRPLCRGIPNSDPRDRFVHLYLTLMVDSFSCTFFLCQRLNLLQSFYFRIRAHLRQPFCVYVIFLCSLL